MVQRPAGLARSELPWATRGRRKGSQPKSQGRPAGCLPGGSQGHRPRATCPQPPPPPAVGASRRHVAAHPLPRPAHLTAHRPRRPAPWRRRRRRRRRPPRSARPPAAAARSAASSSPPQTPARGGGGRAGGRRRPLQGLTKPDGAPRRYLYAEHVVMETHQLKPAAIGSGRGGGAGGGGGGGEGPGLHGGQPSPPNTHIPSRTPPSHFSNPGSARGAGGAGRARQRGRSAARARPPAPPSSPRGGSDGAGGGVPPPARARPARPRAGHALRQARARAPSRGSRLPARRRALWAAGGSRRAPAHSLSGACPVSPAPPPPGGLADGWAASGLQVDVAGADRPCFEVPRTPRRGAC
ncbi:translation initiation factor IF-2-like [Onychomys torridus]|uniref:translation initiation factor IF-2-like n=1 Tax=Onychomys torridus TaxID=38674 RepID=UPI00167F84B7|nr:translation initiation factor IF-2-like [Onychomys torridus]